MLLRILMRAKTRAHFLTSLPSIFDKIPPWKFVGIDLMLSGGNLHAPQDSHESKDQSPFSNITSIIFWWNLFIRILWVFQWNPYLKTDGTSLLILFLVKDPKFNSAIMIMEWFHRKFMEVMVDNRLRAVQRSKSLVIEKSKLACTGLASMFPTFSFATSLISRIKTYQ